MPVLVDLMVILRLISIETNGYVYTGQRKQMTVIGAVKKSKMVVRAKFDSSVRLSRGADISCALAVLQGR